MAWLRVTVSSLPSGLQLSASARVRVTLGLCFLSENIDIATALRARGWREAEQGERAVVQLQWTLRPLPSDALRTLPSGQILNHFARPCELTTKAGLLHALQRLPPPPPPQPPPQQQPPPRASVPSPDPSESTARAPSPAHWTGFFPRSYDLSLDAHYAAFRADFQLTAARCILRRCVAAARVASMKTFPPSVARTAPPLPFESPPVHVVVVCARVCAAHVRALAAATGDGGEWLRAIELALAPTGEDGGARGVPSSPSEEGDGAHADEIGAVPLRTRLLLDVARARTAAAAHLDSREWDAVSAAFARTADAQPDAGAEFQSERGRAGALTHRPTSALVGRLRAVGGGRVARIASAGARRPLPPEKGKVNDVGEDGSAAAAAPGDGRTRGAGRAATPNSARPAAASPPPPPRGQLLLRAAQTAQVAQVAQAASTRRFSVSERALGGALDNAGVAGAAVVACAGASEPHFSPSACGDGRGAGACEARASAAEPARAHTWTGGAERAVAEAGEAAMLAAHCARILDALVKLAARARALSPAQAAAVAPAECVPGAAPSPDVGTSATSGAGGASGASAGRSVLSRALGPAVVSASASSALQLSLEGYDNVWVVKPSYAARGVGIRVEASLARIAAHADSMRVVQKYIERPLLAAGRKFDCRCWLLVTSWRPLTVWFWHGCIVRRAGAPYALGARDLQNQLAHVTNRTVQRRLATAATSLAAAIRLAAPAEPSAGTSPAQFVANGARCASSDALGTGPAAAGARAPPAPTASSSGEDDLLWTGDELDLHLRAEHGLPAGAWSGEILPRFARVCVAALQRAPEASDDARAHPAAPVACCEVFGADLMLDDDLQPWLLELNESPNLGHHSSAVKGALMASLADDVLKVVVDPKFHAAAASARADAGASAAGPVGTRIGLFEKVHDALV